MTMDKNNRIGHVMASEEGQAGFKIYMVVISLLLTALMTITTMGISHMNAVVDAGAKDNIRQDQQNILQAQSIAFNEKQIAAIQSVSAAQVESLHQIANQLTKVSDRVDALQVQSSRPSR